MNIIEPLTKKDKSLWAKKRSSDGQHYWLPLVAHLIDTQNVINWLFYHWLSDGQRQFLSAHLSEEEAEKLVKFIGFTHDIGKATPAFQIKHSFDRDISLDKDILENLVRNGFNELNNLQLSSPRESQHARAGEAILESFKVPCSIAAIIGSHHGRPEEEPQSYQIATYTANYWQKDIVKNDLDQHIQLNWQNVQKSIFEYGLHSSGYHSIDDLPDVSQPEAILLEGLLIMADWLASSEFLEDTTKTPLFPLVSLDQGFDDIDMKHRFRQAMTTWYQQGEWIPQIVDKSEDPYQKRWGFKARPVQEKITNEIDKTVDPGMVIIEAPMGLGKTEIALIAAEQLAYKTGRNGLFMGLPTQATTNAMFTRVEKWLLALAKKQNEKFPIKLMHSRAAFNETYQQIPNASNIDDIGAVVVNSWFAGKKSILTKFTVGTIDNLLLMGLKQKHLFLRHLGFSDKVIIIDEVHAYDSYMNQYLYKAIEWLGAYHVPIIILSATLPMEKRNSLLKAYYKGKYGKRFKKTVIAPENWQNEQAYPLLSIFDGKEIKQTIEFPGQSDQKTVTLQVKRLQDDDDSIIHDILTKIKFGGIAGIIVNTIKRAQKLAKLVPKDINLMILHSAFLAPDRVTQEKKLEKTIGKNANRPDKMVVIGTQVLEQSLDIDFDILYTDIAPMDLLLQRAGRLHRHSLKRPEALEIPQLYIMGINGYGDYGKDNESIYEKYLLMKTDYYLKETIQLPHDISNLVQKVYSQQTDEFVNDIGKAKTKFETELVKKRKKAQAFQIDDPNLELSKSDDETTIHGWLNRGQTQVDTNEQKANAAVRDIQETLEVIMLQHDETGFFLINGRNIKHISPVILAQQLIRLPIAISPSYRIDHIISILEITTYHFFPEWQESRWLRGSLVLLLDKNCSVELDGWKIHYSPILGLSYEKEEKNE